MDSITRLKQILLIIGDIIIAYIALIITLYLRYGKLSSEVVNFHWLPFTVTFIVWLAIFYIGGLYDLRHLKNNLAFMKQWGGVLSVSFLLAIMVFYFVPGVVIEPKTNLFLFMVVFGLLSYFWRTSYNNLLSAGSPYNRILLIGNNKTAQDVATHIEQNPQLGYEIKFWMKDGLLDKEFEHLAQIIIANKINIVVVPAHIKKDSRAGRAIYKNLSLGIEVADLSEIYERIFHKIPLAELEEVWFLENLAKQHRIYEFFKRPIEIFIATIFGLTTIPLSLLVYLFIRLASPGPAIFKQSRAGRSNQVFTIYKFRTMRLDAEKDGPKWADKDDKRVIPLGNILRKSHLDELPQIINILKGDLSLVGPRPERPEFNGRLSREIPYYDLRHIIRPGMTGWAQINYRYGASVQDSYEKLQYDIFYIKNRSIILDILIAVKTLKLLFTSAK
ncbi:MAG: sugar transferase [bacterium]|nr:sugar transferase [bacterium]